MKQASHTVRRTCPHRMRPTCSFPTPQRMGEEVDNQGTGIDTLHQRAETTVGRVQDINQKSQLRKFDVSDKVEDGGV